MKRFTVVLLLGLTGCSGIGQGSTIHSLKIIPNPIGQLEQGALLDKDTATEHYRVYDCFCSNLAAIGTFTDGTRANFSYRVHWTSSDPTKVEVLNAGDTTDLCPLAQGVPGVIIPKGIGTSVITAEFAGLTSSFNVEVVATDGTSFALAPVDPDNTGAVAVGAQLPMKVTATLDNVTRFLSGNVTTWSFDNPDTSVATIGSSGDVRGFGPDGGTALDARAAFATCAVTATTPIRVGEVLAPMTIAEEPGFASDQRIAVNNNEFLKLTAPLDFDSDGTADGSQDLSTQAAFDFTDVCTKRSYLAGGDGSTTLTDCSEVVVPDCASTTPVCSATQTACASTMTACRTVRAPMGILLANRVYGILGAADPTSFFAKFPARRGTSTTVTTAIGASDTTFAIGTYSLYPTLFPWEGVIDKDTASEEIVRVTAASGTTLTVDRGYAGTTAQAHVSGATFDERVFGSDTVGITSTAGTITAAAIETPSGALAPLGTLQLQATGTFTDANSATRTERVSHMTQIGSGQYTLWSSSNTAVARVSSTTGFVTSTSACGGTVVIRARINVSTNADDKAFSRTTDASLDTDGNGNADTNDDACLGTDPLCDQVTLTVPQMNPLPGGVTCN